MRRYKDDKILPISPGRRIFIDGIDAARKPDGYGIGLLDLSAAKKFLEDYEKEKGVYPSYLHLIIKVCSLALKKYPEVNCMLKGYKLVQPSTIDIGISVAGEENIAPVAVIREADTKPLHVIIREFNRISQEVRQKEKENIKKLDRIARWIPGNYIRRKLVAILINNWRVRRELVGTFQISALSFRGVEFMLPAVITTTALLGMGGVAERCIKVGDRIELRPTVYLSFQMDHRVLDGKKCVYFMREVGRLLQNPHELKD